MCQGSLGSHSGPRGQPRVFFLAKKRMPTHCLGGAWHMSADACAWGSAHTLSRRLLGLAGRLFSGWESVTRIRWNAVEDAAPIVTQTIHHSELVGQTENLIKKLNNDNDLLTTILPLSIYFYSYCNSKNKKQQNKKCPF